MTPRRDVGRRVILCVLAEATILSFMSKTSPFLGWMPRVLPAVWTRRTGPALPLEHRATRRARRWRSANESSPRHHLDLIPIVNPVRLPAQIVTNVGPNAGRRRNNKRRTYEIRGSSEGASSAWGSACVGRGCPYCCRACGMGFREFVATDSRTRNVHIRGGQSSFSKLSGTNFGLTVSRYLRGVGDQLDVLPRAES